MSHKKDREKERKKEKKKKGEKVCRICSGKAHSRSGYCLNHLPSEIRCTHITRKGRRCKLPVVEGSDVCKVHLVTMQRGYGKGKYGWVYVYDTTFKEDGKGVYKIGRSVNPTFRVQEFNAANPYGKILFAGFVGPHAKTIESELHKRYQAFWMQKELFVLTDQQVENIRLRLQEVATEWHGDRSKVEVSVIYGRW